MVFELINQVSVAIESKLLLFKLKW